MEKQEPTKKPPKTTSEQDSHVADMVDHYWGSINYVTSLIKASELKAGLVLSFYGILLNFIYNSVDPLFSSPINNIILYILIGLWFVTTAASIFYCVRCFIPKIEGKFDKNILFFGDVITKFGNVKEFANSFYQTSKDEDQLFKQMGEQIFIISKIAAWKFKNVIRAIWLLALGLFLLLTVVVYYVLSTL